MRILFSLLLIAYAVSFWGVASETETIIAELAQLGIALPAIDELRDGSYRLNLSGSRISYIADMAGMNVSHLYLRDTLVSDLSGLKGVPLRSLLLDRTRVSDLTPLYGMPLKILSLKETAVTELSPLGDAPLLHLDLAGCSNVVDISCLTNSPIVYLNIMGTSVKDLEPLRNMPVESLGFSPRSITNGLDMLRAHPTILEVNTPQWGSGVFGHVDQYWAWVDKGRKNGGVGVSP